MSHSHSTPFSILYYLCGNISHQPLVLDPKPAIRKNHSNHAIHGLKQSTSSSLSTIDQSYVNCWIAITLPLCVIIKITWKMSDFSLQPSVCCPRNSSPEDSTLCDPFFLPATDCYKQFCIAWQGAIIIYFLQQIKPLLWSFAPCWRMTDWIEFSDKMNKKTGNASTTTKYSI